MPIIIENILKLLFLSIGLVALYCVLIVVFQKRLIYFPQKYSEDVWQIIDRKLLIHYDIGGEKQVAFYIPAKSTNPPKCLWVMIGGNASLALGWFELINQYSDQSSAFLLVDYPGYGFNEGSPNYIDNLSALNLAYEALLSKLELDNEDFQLSVLGHSLGASLAVNFATTHDVEGLILLSPFTSMQAMVRHVMPVLGNLLSPFLSERYVVDSSLCKLLGGRYAINAVILHGSDDQVVPVYMSRILAEENTVLDYIELSGADHNFISGSLPIIIKSMEAACNQRDLGE